MKTYRYSEPGPNGEDITVTLTEEHILKKYFNEWLGLMSKAKKLEDLIIRREGLDILRVLQNECITDFTTVHWAHEVKDKGFTIRR